MRCDMHILVTQSAKHLIHSFNPSLLVPYQCDHREDGELSMRLLSYIELTSLVIISQIASPAEHVLELAFLLHFLSKQKQKINVYLFLSYLSYGRYDFAEKYTIAPWYFLQSMLQLSIVKKINVLHSHDTVGLNKIISFKDRIDWQLFCVAAQAAEYIVAPDKGAEMLAQQLSQKTGKPYLVLHKKRITPQELIIRPATNNIAVIKNKRVLVVDDMIASGLTAEQVAFFLHSAGVKELFLAATHFVGNNNVLQKIKPLFKQITISNSVPSAAQGQEKIIGIIKYDISPFIAQSIITD